MLSFMALTEDQRLFLDTVKIHFDNLSVFIETKTAHLSAKPLSRRDLMMCLNHLNAAQQYLRSALDRTTPFGESKENSDGRSPYREPAGDSPENFTRPRPGVGIEEGSEISGARNGAQEVHES